jgi:nitroimidazol reductase NimA-like FMN-containing flavoprotein (pyridoxamine 5'-phosphate oxidase superfamily)
MFIHNMTEAECRHALGTASVGRLACARDNQPYVVPIYFAYDEHYLYAISTLGQKIDWMRANPLVCIEVDNITSHDEWMSVIVLGRYEELPDLPEFKLAREQALYLLQRRSVWWWEPACICDHRDTPHSCTPVAYRIHINRVSGLHATPDSIQNKEALEQKPMARRTSWFSTLLGDRREAQRKERSLQ